MSKFLKDVDHEGRIIVSEAESYGATQGSLTLQIIILIMIISSFSSSFFG